MSRQIVAIDIRNTSITAVLLSTGLKTGTIERCAHIELPAADAEQAPLQAALAQLSQQLDLRNAGAVISLPADQTLYRSITLPFKDDKKIRQVLPFELEPTLPVPVDSLIIDHQKVRTSENTELFAVAIERQNLNAVMAILAQMQIQTELVVPGDFALPLALANVDPSLPDQAVVLSVGRNKSTLTAMASRKIVLARCFSSNVASVEGAQLLALNIRQTLIAFSDGQPGGFAPQKLYLSGPALHDETVTTRLIGSLGITAQTVDLRTMVAYLDTTDAAQWQPCVMNGALAMALVEAERRPCPNFHRTGSLFRNFWTTYHAYVRGPAVALAVVIVLAIGGIVLENHLLQRRLDHINAQTEAIFATTFPDSRRVGDPLSQMKSELRKIQTGNLDTGAAIPQVRTVDVLHQLSVMIPEELDVLFNRMVMGGDGFTISGETAGFDIVDDIKNRLEKSALFSQVTIASANMDRSGKKVRFSLKLEL
jgi:general secretion pathway protein L